MENKSKLSIGDLISIEKAEKSDTFYMVTIDGEKYLVDRNGKIVLTPGQRKPTVEIPPMSSQVSEEKIVKTDSLPKPDSAVRIRLRVKPGTPEFSQAVKEASSYLDFYSETLLRYYRWITSRFDVYNQTREPYMKYMDLNKIGLSNLQAFLIRDFFTRTKYNERGLEIIEFLTTVIAYRIDGLTNADSQLPIEEQRDMVVSYIEFIKKLGDVPIRERVIIKTYLEFTEELSVYLKGVEGVGFYIRSTLQRFYEKQRFFLDSEGNRNFLNTNFQKLMKQPSDFFLDNILAFLKATTILRLNSHSHKEERGIDDQEREDLLYRIISFQPQSKY